MPGNEYYTLDQVKAALRKTGGLRAPASRLLAKMTGRGSGYRGAIDNYIKRHPELLDYIDSIFEETLDVAETKLIKILKNDKHKGQLQAVTFYLQTKGKKRGYVKRQEMTGEEGAPIKYAHVDELDLSKLSDEELDQLDVIFAKAQSKIAARNGNGRARPRLNGHADGKKKKKKRRA